MMGELNNMKIPTISDYIERLKENIAKFESSFQELMAVYPDQEVINIKKKFLSLTFAQIEIFTQSFYLKSEQIQDLVKILPTTTDHLITETKKELTAIREESRKRKSVSHSETTADSDQLQSKLDEVSKMGYLPRHLQAIKELEEYAALYTAKALIENHSWLVKDFKFSHDQIIQIIKRSTKNISPIFQLQSYYPVLSKLGFIEDNVSLFKLLDSNWPAYYLRLINQYSGKLVLNKISPERIVSVLKFGNNSKEQQLKKMIAEEEAIIREREINKMLRQTGSPLHTTLDTTKVSSTSSGSQLTPQIQQFPL
jgi:hypothetical protein